MLKKLPVAEIIVIALALAAGAGVYWYAHRDGGRLGESKERGAAIVAGLEAYRAQHGTYPEQLDELVPQYVPRIEAPTWGLERWRYRRFTPADVAALAAAAAERRPETTAAHPADAASDAGAPAGGDDIYFQLSVAANESGYPVLYYDYTARRWVLNN
jgi:type II secretory pathway pseudopilin PulG